jgi:hypothetical protein
VGAFIFQRPLNQARAFIVSSVNRGRRSAIINHYLSRLYPGTTTAEGLFEKPLLIELFRRFFGAKRR